MNCEWPPKLVEELANRRAIIFVGSGLTSSCVDENGNRPPSWDSFIKNFIDEIKKNGYSKKSIKFIEQQYSQKNYLMALQAIFSLSNSSTYSHFLKRQFDVDVNPSEAYKCLIDIDSDIVISTNFDQVLDRLYSSVAGYVVANYDDYSRIIENIKSPKKLLIKAHGSIDDTTKMIFTSEEYFRIRRENSAFYEILKSLFMVHSVLFIGYSLNDPDIQLILESLADLSVISVPNHILLQKGDAHEEMIKYWKNVYNIEVIEYDGENYENFIPALKKLRDEVQELR